MSSRRPTTLERALGQSVGRLVTGKRVEKSPKPVERITFSKKKSVKIPASEALRVSHAMKEQADNNSCPKKTKADQETKRLVAERTLINKEYKETLRSPKNIPTPELFRVLYHNPKKIDGLNSRIQRSKNTSRRAYESSPEPDLKKASNVLMKASLSLKKPSLPSL